MYLSDLSHKDNEEQERVKRYREESETPILSTPLLSAGDPTPYWKIGSNLYYEAYKAIWKTGEEDVRPK